MPQNQSTSEQNQDTFQTLIKKSDFLFNIINDTHTKLGSLLSKKNIKKWLTDEGVIFNLHINTHNQDRIHTQLEMLYGMEGTIKNLETFLHFCSIHGLTPRINDITINGEGLKNYPELHSLILFLLKEKDLLFSLDIMNDIKKLEKSTIEKLGYETIREILQIIIVFSRYNQSEYSKIYGPKIQKLRMTNTFAENIFLEIAMEMEKQIRKTLHITSTYMHLAKFDEDMYFKTDMKYLFRKDEDDQYIPYPVQFTLGEENSHNMQKKEKKIENFLQERILRKKMSYKDFIVLAVNGNFTNYITSKKIKNTYIQWRKETKRSHNANSLPFFMKKLDREKIVPAQVMYIILNKIYTEFNFSQDTENTGKIWKKIDFGKHESDDKIIHTIPLKDIKIFTKYRKLAIKQSYDHLNTIAYMTKRRFSVNYQRKHIGRISIYRNPNKIQ